MLTERIVNKEVHLPEGWKINSIKHIHSNEFVQLYEDIIDIRGKEKVYTRIRRKDYSTNV